MLRRLLTTTSHSLTLYLHEFGVSRTESETLILVVSWVGQVGSSEFDIQGKQVVCDRVEQVLGGMGPNEGIKGQSEVESMLD